MKHSEPLERNPRINDSPVISIFMPVYNGGKYLEESIESVISQTFTDFELVCVDDSSTDNSFSILQAYARIDQRVIVFQKANGGNVPKSWNYVIPHLRGKFISYMSQDDLMSPDNLSENYKRHLETGADIILPDMIYYYQGKNNNSGIYGLGDKIITGEEAFILSLSWLAHGFTLCKAEIMKSEAFREDIFNSDEYITRKNFLMANKVAFSNGIFYYRQDNENALTKKFSMNFLDSLTMNEMLAELTENHFGPNSQESRLMNEKRKEGFINILFQLLKSGKQLSKTDMKKAQLIMRAHYDKMYRCSRKILSHNKLYAKSYHLFIIYACINLLIKKIFPQRR